MYHEMSEGGNDWFSQIREAKESTQNLTGRAVRKDAVVLCSTVESVPASWDPETCKAYFVAKARWYENYLHEKAGVDKGAMKSLVVHLDETTPHATYAWIPMKDGRLQAKNILSKSFLRDLQKDSQKYTFDWIDHRNAQHPEKQLERLDPYKIDSGMKHLQEQEYKEKKIAENLQTMTAELQQTEQRIEKLTGADLKTYESVLQENRDLRLKVSFQDQIISQLSSDVDLLKSESAEYKEKFADISRKIGRQGMDSLGYDVSGIERVPEFPAKHVASKFSEMQENLTSLDPKKLRVIPDDKTAGAYRVVKKTSAGYKTVKAGFATRAAAMAWKSNAVGAAIEVAKKGLELINSAAKSGFNNM